MQVSDDWKSRGAYRFCEQLEVPTNVKALSKKIPGGAFLHLVVNSTTLIKEAPNITRIAIGTMAQSRLVTDSMSHNTSNSTLGLSKNACGSGL